MKKIISNVVLAALLFITVFSGVGLAAEDESWKSISYDPEVIKTWKHGQIIDNDPHTVVDFSFGKDAPVFYVLIYQGWERVGNTLSVSWLIQKVDMKTGKLTQATYIGGSDVVEYFDQKDNQSITFADNTALPPKSERPLTDPQAKKLGQPKTVDWLYDVRFHWASSYIFELFEKKVISGYPDGSFKPNEQVTYEHFIKMLVVQKGLTINWAPQGLDQFANWARPYIQTSLDAEIVTSEDLNNVIKGTSIPREVAVKFLIKALDKEVTETQVLTFKDQESITFKDEVATATTLKIIGGYPDGTFRPLGTLTRAEASKILTLYGQAVK